MFAPLVVQTEPARHPPEAHEEVFDDSRGGELPGEIRAFRDAGMGSFFIDTPDIGDLARR